MDILKKWEAIIVSWDKIEVVFENWSINIDWMLIDFPWEYEKSWIMWHVIEKWDKILFQINFLWKNIAYINYSELTVDESVVDFFWDIDILIIKWSKESIKIFENLEAKRVVPTWEQKDIFFSTLWQHPEEEESHKIREQVWENEVIFINLI